MQSDFIENDFTSIDLSEFLDTQEMAEETEESGIVVLTQNQKVLCDELNSRIALYSPQHNKLRDFYIKEAIHFIEQNFQNHITVEEIASVCGINRSYFGKIFRKSIGRSPQEFLMNYRMVKATELLKLTSLSIAEIGSAVGYENQLHFSRAFKTVYGISPRQWRNHHKSPSSS